MTNEQKLRGINSIFEKWILAYSGIDGDGNYMAVRALEHARDDIRKALSQTSDEGTPLREAISAAKNMDWQQVVLNGGPPCFHLEEGRFCGRAARWAGHDEAHKFVSLADLMLAATPTPSDSKPGEGT